MSIDVSTNNENDYFLLNKIIITEGSIFNFNIFIKSAKETFILVYNKKQEVTKAQELQFQDKTPLYINKKDKDQYLNLYNKLIDTVQVPDRMKTLYSEFSKSMDTIFENPESPDTVKNSKVIVNNMIDTIMSDDFTVTSLITILSYDYYTHTHSLNTSVYALCLGKELGLSKSKLEDLGTAALLHDLGKSQVHKSIINKKGKLTEREFNEVKKHPALGYELAKKLQITNNDILQGIRHHHEKIDGNGYPDGLKDNQIHIYARIIGICDIFDALTTKRSYKDEVSTFDTLIMMKTKMAHQLDKNILNTFIQIFHTKNS